MSRVILSPRAKMELSDIWDYTLTEWGAEQAEKYVRDLWETLQGLPDDLNMSIDIGDVRKGYRKARCASHVIFFKIPRTGSVDVVRILHQKMDFDKHI